MQYQRIQLLISYERISPMRRILIALISCTLALTLSACGAGLNASTRQVKQVTDGVENAITTDGNNIKLRNILVVETAQGAGVLIGTLVNANPDDDTLLGVAINGQVATLTGINTVSQNQPVTFEGASANAKAVIPTLGATAGSNVLVTMFFARAGEVTVQAIIRAATEQYAGITA